MCQDDLVMPRMRLFLVLKLSSAGAADCLAKICNRSFLAEKWEKEINFLFGQFHLKIILNSFEKHFVEHVFLSKF